MTLAIAFRLLFDVTAEVHERSIFMATDSRITYDPGGTVVDDGAKLILLEFPAVLAYAGRVDLGEKSLALAVKLMRPEPRLTFEEIKELTLTAFNKFYRSGEDLWGLLGVVSTDGKHDHVWKLAPHGSELRALDTGNPAMIGAPGAQAAYETYVEESWTKFSTIRPGPHPPTAVGIAQQHHTIFNAAIEEMHRQGTSTIGGPVQALLVKKDGWFAFSGAKYNEQKAEWEPVRPSPGDVHFRYREPELRDLRRY